MLIHFITRVITPLIPIILNTVTARFGVHICTCLNNQNKYSGWRSHPVQFSGSIFTEGLGLEVSPLETVQSSLCQRWGSWSRLLKNISKDGDSTASPGNLPQCLTTLTLKSHRVFSGSHGFPCISVCARWPMTIRWTPRRGTWLHHLRLYTWIRSP